jgi:hypothetical protein
LIGREIAATPLAVPRPQVIKGIGLFEFTLIEALANIGAAGLVLAVNQCLEAQIFRTQRTRSISAFALYSAKE